MEVSLMNLHHFYHQEWTLTFFLCLCAGLIDERLPTSLSQDNAIHRGGAKKINAI
jgi:hypothetical protein